MGSPVQDAGGQEATDGQLKSKFTAQEPPRNHKSEQDDTQAGNEVSAAGLVWPAGRTVPSWSPSPVAGGVWSAGGACMPRLRQVAYTSHQTEGPAQPVMAQSLWRPWVGAGGGGELRGVRRSWGSRGRLWGRTGSQGGADWGEEHQDLGGLQGAQLGTSLPVESPGRAEPLPVAPVGPLHTYRNTGLACSVVETPTFGVSPLPLRPEIGRNSEGGCHFPARPLPHQIQKRRRRGPGPWVQVPSWTVQSGGTLGAAGGSSPRR